MTDFETIKRAVIEGNDEKMAEFVQEMLDSGISPEEILDEGLSPGMSEVGELFKNQEYYVPEVLLAARAMTVGVEVLKPYLVKNVSRIKAKVMIGTVQGDLHDIGKNLVILMLESAGYQVIDLGIDVPPAKFLEVYEQEHPSIIGMSTMITTTMKNMKTVMDVFTQENKRSEVKFIVGGAPVSKDYAQMIGADGYADDAKEAVTLVDSIRSITGGKK